MIVSLIGSVLGMAGGLLPDVMREIKDSREHSRELDRMAKTATIQLEQIKVRADAKMAEVRMESDAAESRAYLDQMRSIVEAQARPVGIKFVDGFNAMLRPSTAALIMVLFVSTSGMYVWSVLHQVSAGVLQMTDAASIIWSSLVGDSIQAVLGFLFGYRSTRGRIGHRG